MKRVLTKLFCFFTCRKTNFYYSNFEQTMSGMCVVGTTPLYAYSMYMKYFYTTLSDHVDELITVKNKKKIYMKNSVHVMSMFYIDRIEFTPIKYSQ